VKKAKTKRTPAKKVKSSATQFKIRRVGRAISATTGLPYERYEAWLGDTMYAAGRTRQEALQAALRIAKRLKSTRNGF
jgi:predicted solute-binding protein